jgi:hypothetical protein
LQAAEAAENALQRVTAAFEHRFRPISLMLSCRMPPIA